jgi:putative transcriptional regulator
MTDIKSPDPEQIRAAREAQGLTQTQAAALIHHSMRGWQDWEHGKRTMHPGLWELFCIKTALPSTQSHA